jgi:hypothetical protein
MPKKYRAIVGQQDRVVKMKDFAACSRVSRNPAYGAE